MPKTLTVYLHNKKCPDGAREIYLSFRPSSTKSREITVPDDIGGRSALQKYLFGCFGIDPVPRSVRIPDEPFYHIERDVVKAALGKPI